MTRFHWILLILALVTWIPPYAWFFHREVAHWWQQRGLNRAQARRERAEREAEQTRLREELAAKYLSAGAGPRA